MADQIYTYYETLHAMPEVAFCEENTANYLHRQLTQMGYAPQRIGGTGIYADLLMDPQLPWVILRSDMDALAVTEQTGVAYASQNPGKMHACGHDAHMAMLLAAAAELKDKKLPRNIRFLFQPAEESTHGANKLLEQEVLPANAAAIFGMHVWHGVPKGKILAKTGALMASCTTIDMVCRGRCAHCGQREKGADALLTAVQIASGFSVAEAEAQGDGSALFCGSLHAGTSHNIVAEEAVLHGTLRTFSENSRQKILQKLEQIVRQSERTYGTTVEITYSSYAPAVTNPPTLTEQVRALLPDTLEQAQPVLIAEDFSQYQKYCPGVFLWLGVGDTAPLHNGKFLVPQEVLPIGVNAWVALAQHPW